MNPIYIAIMESESAILVSSSWLLNIYHVYTVYTYAYVYVHIYIITLRIVLSQDKLGECTSIWNWLLFFLRKPAVLGGKVCSTSFVSQQILAHLGRMQYAWVLLYHFKRVCLLMAPFDCSAWSQYLVNEHNASQQAFLDSRTLSKVFQLMHDVTVALMHDEWRST